MLPLVSVSVLLTFLPLLSLHLTSEQSKVTPLFQLNDICSFSWTRTYTHVLLAAKHFRPLTQVWFDREVWLRKIPWGASRNDRGTEKKKRVGGETGMKTERENGRKRKTLCYSCTKISHQYYNPSSPNLLSKVEIIIRFKSIEVALENENLWLFYLWSGKQTVSDEVSGQVSIQKLCGV